jgi:hypothetical protein
MIFMNFCGEIMMPLHERHQRRQYRHYGFTASLATVDSAEENAWINNFLIDAYARDPRTATYYGGASTYATWINGLTRPQRALGFTTMGRKMATYFGLVAFQVQPKMAITLIGPRVIQTILEIKIMCKLLWIVQTVQQVGSGMINQNLTLLML